MALTNSNHNPLETQGNLEKNSAQASTGLTFYVNSVVAIGSNGYLQKPSNAANVLPVGISKIEKTTIDGDDIMEYWNGRIKIPFSGSSIANVGNLIYCTDDNTFVITRPSNNPLPLGLIIKQETGFYWVDTRIKSI